MLIEFSIPVERFKEKERKNEGIRVVLCFTQSIWKSA